LSFKKKTKKVGILGNFLTENSTKISPFLGKKLQIFLFGPKIDILKIY
jgi:hypothetical protein